MCLLLICLCDEHYSHNLWPSSTKMKYSTFHSRRVLYVCEDSSLWEIDMHQTLQDVRARNRRGRGGGRRWKERTWERFERECIRCTVVPGPVGHHWWYFQNCSNFHFFLYYYYYYFAQILFLKENRESDGIFWEVYDLSKNLINYSSNTTPQH